MSAVGRHTKPCHTLDPHPFPGGNKTMSMEADKWQAYIQRDAAARPDDNEVPPGFKPAAPWKPVQFGVDFVGWRRPLRHDATPHPEAPSPTTVIPWIQSVVQFYRESPGIAYDAGGSHSIPGFAPTGPWGLVGSQRVNGMLICYWEREGTLDLTQAPRDLWKRALSVECPKDKPEIPGYKTGLWSQSTQWAVVRGRPSVWRCAIYKEETKQ